MSAGLFELKNLPMLPLSIITLYACTVNYRGLGSSGQLGQGDDENIGDEPGVLADTPSIDLGSETSSASPTPSPTVTGDTLSASPMFLQIYSSTVSPTVLSRARWFRRRQRPSPHPDRRA